MPVILDKENESVWLSNEMTAGDINALTKPYKGKDLEAHTVSKLVTARGRDRNVPEAIKKFDYKEMN